VAGSANSARKLMERVANRVFVRSTGSVSREEPEIRAFHVP
jgi:hypothetical protein